MWVPLQFNFSLALKCSGNINTVGSAWKQSWLSALQAPGISLPSLRHFWLASGSPSKAAALTLSSQQPQQTKVGTDQCRQRIWDTNSAHYSWLSTPTKETQKCLLTQQLESQNVFCQDLEGYPDGCYWPLGALLEITGHSLGDRVLFYSIVCVYKNKYLREGNLIRLLIIIAYFTI